MNRNLILKTTLTSLAIALFFSIAASAQSQPQPPSPQPNTSLADAARKMRAQKDAQAADNVSRAQQVANELSEDQNDQHAKPAAPDATATDKAATANSQPASANATPVAPQAAAPQADEKSAQPSVASSIPAGFKAYPFTYCSGAQHCFNASILIPADAKLVSSDCKQSIFETKIHGTPFLLMAGAANCESPGGPNLVRWNELVDPETKRPQGTYNLISTQATTIDGKPASVVTIGFRKGLDSFMGKRIEVESNGVPLVVGCIAPRDNFPDGDAACSTMMNSLQMP